MLDPRSGEGVINGSTSVVATTLWIIRRDARPLWQQTTAILGHPTLFLNTLLSGHIAVFPILADVVEVKKGSRSTAHWSNDFIRLNRWLRNSFAQLITPLDIDSIGQNWEDSNTQYNHAPASERRLSLLRERLSRIQHKIHHF